MNSTNHTQYGRYRDVLTGWDGYAVVRLRTRESLLLYKQNTPHVSLYYNAS